MGGKTPLCIDCYLKMQQAMRIQQTTIAELMNYLTGEMEAAVGLPGLLPRYEVAKTPVVTGPVTLHNIRVDNSTVGAINTGEIQKLDVVLTHVKEGGNPALALALQILTQATIDDENLDEEYKNEALQHLSFLGSQAVLSADQRHGAVCTLGIAALETIMQRSATLARLFEAVKSPVLGTFDSHT